MFLCIISELSIQFSALGRRLALNYLEPFWVDQLLLFYALKGEEGSHLFESS